MPSFKSSLLFFVNSSGTVVILHQAENLSRNKSIANKFSNLCYKPVVHNYGLEHLLGKQGKSAYLSITLPVGGAYHNEVKCQIYCPITYTVEQHLKVLALLHRAFSKLTTNILFSGLFTDKP